MIYSTTETGVPTFSATRQLPSISARRRALAFTLEIGAPFVLLALAALVMIALFAVDELLPRPILSVPMWIVVFPPAVIAACGGGAGWLSLGRPHQAAAVLVSRFGLSMVMFVWSIWAIGTAVDCTHCNDAAWGVAAFMFLVWISLPVASAALLLGANTTPQRDAAEHRAYGKRRFLCAVLLEASAGAVVGGVGWLVLRRRAAAVAVFVTRFALAGAAALLWYSERHWKNDGESSFTLVNWALFLALTWCLSGFVSVSAMLWSGARAPVGSAE